MAKCITRRHGKSAPNTKSLVLRFTKIVRHEWLPLAHIRCYITQHCATLLHFTTLIYDVIVLQSERNFCAFFIDAFSFAQLFSCHFMCVRTSSVQSWLPGDGKEESRVSRRIICVHVRIVREREKYRGNSLWYNMHVELSSTVESFGFGGG